MQRIEDLLADSKRLANVWGAGIGPRGISVFIDGEGEVLFACHDLRASFELLRAAMNANPTPPPTRIRIVEE